MLITRALPRLPAKCKPCDTLDVVAVARLARHLVPVVDVLYPPRCPACGDAIAQQEGLCVECWAKLAIPSHVEHAGDVVPVYAATLYNDTSRKLVLAYKHGGRIGLSRMLGRMMASVLPEPLSGASPTILVPVPLHRWRLWQRGYNQAALLAKELAQMGKGDVVLDALLRHRRTPNLGGLGRDARERLLRDAIKFNVVRARSVAGRNVVVVDDVLTSGATSRACIAALTDAGAASVAVACFARVEHDHLNDDTKT
ncbi:ComF family protein [Erythrobacter sp. R86502]|uniref:ComF family protein n=1 Tax=Erythrobacter sp. R86502 TaxID=3093846 RepID=UPI0036D24645